MADKKFAIKRNRTSKEANLRNRARISELKTLEKKFRAAVAGGEAEGANTVARELTSKLDKAAKVGTIHANRAANKKSQIGKLLNTIGTK
jgi:small subunit ribosomal protein S20